MKGVARYKRPPLYTKQRNAFFAPERFVFIEGSTKSGKTVGSMAWLLEQAMKAKSGDHALWVAPIYPQAKIAYLRYKRGLPKGIAKFNDSDLFILLGNGVRIWFKGGDKPDSIYGQDYKAAIIDEASRTKDDLWTAVRSTLTATQGPIRAIGNVRGRQNWHYRMCRKAEGDEKNYKYFKLVAQDAIDGKVLAAEEIEQARRDLSERVFNELYCCIPSDDGGNPFGASAILKCIKPLSTKRAMWYGVDLAKSVDWTVIIGLDEDGDVCYFDRWQAPWLETAPRLASVIGETHTYVDSTGVGDPIAEMLQKTCAQVEGFKFSAPSKQKLMEGLAVGIQQQLIGYPEGIIVTELDQFEYEYKPSGVRYSAPEGYHDDCVMALALAQMRRMQPIEGMGAFGYAQMMAEKNNPTTSPSGNRTGW